MSDVSSNQQTKTLPWSPIIGVLLVIGLYFVAPVIGSLLVGGIGRPFNLDIESTLAQFLFIAVVETLTVAGLVWFVRRRGASLKTLGFDKPKLKYIGLGLAVYPLYFILFLVIVLAATKLFPGLNVDQDQQLGFDNITGTLPLIMTFISLVVLPPIVEELTVRGMLFTSLRSKLKFWVAAFLTSLIFAAAHLPEGGAAGPLYIAALDTFALSMVLCVLREKTGSLWPCITLHALKNGIAYVSLYIIVAK